MDPIFEERKRDIWTEIDTVSVKRMLQDASYVKYSEDDQTLSVREILSDGEDHSTVWFHTLQCINLLEGDFLHWLRLHCKKPFN